ncbi:RNA-splicing ligase RtcB [Thermogemmatispora aurantia]|jgi:tRNA-splicing ligase RtcB|uniref:tRNA-splicing ligase RtcB n=1 Tax=Thermogemmatispora aurantia TaxID=2045279 RepID=A0A5J4K9R3_9CHLR|nr:RtcB family protein [Thermogemmatispora aurantia]GER83479.1 RNA-splicing ligase RtcB [Thermogemmatispora aurantia]
MSDSGAKVPLQRIDAYRWRIPQSYQPEMRVPGIVYADDVLIEQIRQDNSLQQVANVATLPGIVGYSLAMPDIHWGYGFPVGGVAATHVDDGVISPGGIGFDINCGVRLLATDLRYQEVKGKADRLADELFQHLPSGVGGKGMRSLSEKELREVMVRGAAWAVEQGYGFPEDLEVTEEGGCLAGANPEAVSTTAIQRGVNQLGSLGAGNHFCEVQVVDYIYDEEAARALGLYYKDQVVTTIHCGSRGFGHQIAEDYIRVAETKQKDFGFRLVDRQLACLPLRSDLGKSYLGAMACGANFAWANRQLLMHGVRQAFSRVFGRQARPAEMPLVYDVCHNIAKIEEYRIDGELQRVCVHRKGATRAFPAGHPAVPEKYRAVGQPVLIPGDMGRYSFVLVGAPGSMEQSFGTTCHGAGRQRSRTAAKKAISSKDLMAQLEAKGIAVRVHSKGLLAEEAPLAYKDAEQVVRVVHNAGLARLVVRLRPIIVVKG